MGRQLHRAVALGVALCAVAMFTACGDDDKDASAGSARGSNADQLPPTDPVVRFAPQLRLDPEEEWLPISANRFLYHSGLEWIGGRCGERDLTASGTIPRGEPIPLPRLDPSRLGSGPKLYRARRYGVDCRGRRPPVYASDQPSRPYDDTADRPAGLAVDEGFSLDIASEGQRGEGTPAKDGTLHGVPVYYERSRIHSSARSSARISYWMLFGFEDDDDPRRRPSDHEGDWERVDVLLASGKGGGEPYRPLAVERWTPTGRDRVPWTEVGRTGSDREHPIVQLSLGRHTPQLAGDCEDCIRWDSWRDLRNLRDEPWWGYRGGWGAIGLTAATSGPAGPSP